jgi:5-methylcytosine-specific restriction endonuclease McrA
MKIQTLKPRIPESNGRMAVPAWTDNKRIRGTTLQNIRKAHFAKHPLCVRCLEKTPPRVAVAVELDHVVPLHQGGIDSPDPFINRAGLCDECHLEKSKTERGHRYNPTRGAR